MSRQEPTDAFGLPSEATYRNQARSAVSKPSEEHIETKHPDAAHFTSIRVSIPSYSTQEATQYKGFDTILHCRSESTQPAFACLSLTPMGRYPLTPNTLMRRGVNYPGVFSKGFVVPADIVLLRGSSASMILTEQQWKVVPLSLSLRERNR